MSESRRIRGLSILLVGLTVIVIGRLFSISVLQNADYVAKAEDQQNVERDIQPRRGTIFVQDKAANRTVAVAQSVERYAISATPRNVKNKEAYAAKLAELTGADHDSLLKALQKDNLYMDPFARNLTQADVERIAEAINELEKSLNPVFKGRVISFDSTQGNVMYFTNGTFFIRDYYRAYPEGALMGQLLGFVDDRGKGQYGIEGQYDQELRGYQGRVRLERDSAGNLLGESGAIDGRDGLSYELTIDRNVQYFIEQALAEQVKESEAKGGSVIVLDPRNGEIVGMASTPTYDPNAFRQAAKDNIGVFDNPAISKQWEPGSIFKPLIMAAAIDQGVVTKDTKDTFAATVVVDGYTINTALKKAYGLETMTDVLVNSDNVAMVWLANKMGNQMMSDYLAKLGFGKATGVDLRNEINGNVRPVNQWAAIHRATFSFGQGVAVTPLQVAAAYSALADGGVMKKPHIVKAVVHPDGSKEVVEPPAGEQVIKKETSDQLLQMLTSVIVKAHRRAGVDGYKLGGKTGTAQVPNPDGPGYLEGQYNHSFVGIGPIDAPEFVILTKIDQPNVEKVGQFAEATAVPLFSKVSNFLLHYNQIAPTNR